MIRACSWAYHGIINVSFSENFMYVLNEWPLFETMDILSFWTDNSTVFTEFSSSSFGSYVAALGKNEKSK